MEINNQVNPYCQIYDKVRFYFIFSYGVIQDTPKPFDKLIDKFGLSHGPSVVTRLYISKKNVYTGEFV